MPTFKQRLAGIDAPAAARPLWTGPCGEGRNGGCTQSMIGRWVSCRERFRVAAVEGLRPAESFEAPLEYGSMHHCAEEHHQRGEDWRGPLAAYCAGLHRKFPFQRDQVNHWQRVCEAVFPYYVRYWERHPDEVDWVPLEQEKAFDTPYPLPSGRVVRLRGKRDAAGLIRGGRLAGVWLKENKTKSQIDQVRVMQQLNFDIQTLLYLIALGANDDEEFWRAAAEQSGLKGSGYRPAVRGVRYCVVRRSAHKSNDRGELPGLEKKLAEDERDGRLGEWFARWTVAVSPEDVARFKAEFLTPALESVCDDYEWWAHCFIGGRNRWDGKLREKTFPRHRARHWRLPYGVYSPVSEGGFSDVDAYIRDGNSAGLRRTEILFPELEEAS